MQHSHNAVQWVARTAMGIALIIVAQLLGKVFPAGAVIVGPFSVNQLVTGSLVNCVLFVFTAVGGLWSGVTMGIVSAMLAQFIGIGPAVSGGVAQAVAEAIARMDPTRRVDVDYGDGLRECRKMLTLAKAGKRNGYLLEGMACPGGCVAGAGTIQPVMAAANNVRTYKAKAAVQSSLDSAFVDRLEEVEE